uniref:NADH dehydrogenase subunit 6 n=1 Tax=Utterbackia peninsularis TaxID=872316 RepID=F4ZG77_9BIVA|nr:NADH dehydrogenase subunit 6 [Utterbackia peninsularis]ADL62602.1 NADH dehydrogenase subunit 6 [Utterbackia peninsularis]
MTLALFMFLMIFSLLNTMTTSHPLALSLKVLSFALTVCLAVSFNTTWYAYMIFMVTLGGVLVMFTYISSLTPNSIFKPSISLSILLTQAMIALIIGYDFIMFSQKAINTQKPFSPPEDFIAFFFSDKNCTLILMMASILLLAMLFITSLLSNSTGAMRPTVYHQNKNMQV